jgi:hypothetical protein
MHQLSRVVHEPAHKQKSRALAWAAFLVQLQDQLLDLGFFVRNVLACFRVEEVLKVTAALSAA